MIISTHDGRPARTFAPPLTEHVLCRLPRPTPPPRPLIACRLLLHSHGERRYNCNSTSGPQRIDSNWWWRHAGSKGVRARVAARRAGAGGQATAAGNHAHRVMQAWVRSQVHSRHQVRAASRGRGARGRAVAARAVAHGVDMAQQASMHQAGVAATKCRLVGNLLESQDGMCPSGAHALFLAAAGCGLSSAWVYRPLRGPHAWRPCVQAACRIAAAACGMRPDGRWPAPPPGCLLLPLKAAQRRPVM